MTGNSGIVLLVIAFTFFAGARTEPCSHKYPEYKIAGEGFYRAFSDVVRARISEPDSENITVITNTLREKSFEFLDVANRTCKSGSLEETSNHTFFLEMINFSLRNSTALKVLQMDGGFKCIKEQKTNIDQCVVKNLANDSMYINQTKTGRLMRKTHLKFDSLTCAKTDSIRKCTLKILKTHCIPTAVNYVESLFDFVGIRCKEVTEKITTPSGSHKITGCGATFTMLALGSGLVMLNF